MKTNEMGYITEIDLDEAIRVIEPIFTDPLSVRGNGKTRMLTNYLTAWVEIRESIFDMKNRIEELEGQNAFECGCVAERDEVIEKQKAELVKVYAQRDFYKSERDNLERTLEETGEKLKDTAKEALEQFICECLDEHIVGVNDKEYMQMLELKDDILRECYGVEVE